VTLVTPDPNTMLRVARLRDATWPRPAGVRGTDEKPRMMSFSDAVQIASTRRFRMAARVKMFSMCSSVLAAVELLEARLDRA
jgi:hypothetical protein